MWNWKLIYEDKDILCYCDIENVADAEEYVDGIFRSQFCYQPLSNNVIIWVTFFYKSQQIIKHYTDYLKINGLYNEQYKNLSNTLCLVEFKADENKYRVIPALDYDNDGKEIGVSKIITDEGTSFIKGIKGDWSSVKSRDTNKAIKATYKFLFKRQED
ncbi:MAG TPA: hypothetical protein PLM71_05560 [Syntrophorhabdaceae bacterium]|nr:hypothetical protein [Syntrophorhabdaceae bacterium]HPU29771.1 hypothetical protein [Syntrophorhabdaceae bacterium]